MNLIQLAWLLEINYQVFSTVWSEWNYDPQPPYKESIINQPIWYNRLLKIWGRTIFYAKWYNQKVKACYKRSYHE